MRHDGSWVCSRTFIERRSRVLRSMCAGFALGFCWAPLGQCDAVFCILCPYLYCISNRKCVCTRHQEEICPFAQHLLQLLVRVPPHLVRLRVPPCKRVDILIAVYMASVASWRVTPSSASGMIGSWTMSTQSCRTRWCSFRSPTSLLIH